MRKNKFMVDHGRNIAANMDYLMREYGVPRTRGGVLDMMDVASMLVIIDHLKAIGGIAPTNTCEGIIPGDEANLATAKIVRMKISAAQRQAEIAWTFEHGQWRVADVN